MTSKSEVARPVRLVGISGSLRAGSLNSRLLNLVGRSLPPLHEIQRLEWRDVPAFDADLLAQGWPASVAKLRREIAEADGLVIVTPEYNFSLPGMLKNAIDWLSRGEDQPFAGKPVAILSAATGPLGGARVQYDLRKVMLFVNANVLVKPEVFVGQAQTKFDADGACTDVATRDFVRAQMLAFAKWIDAARHARS